MIPLRRRVLVPLLLLGLAAGILQVAPIVRGQSPGSGREFPALVRELSEPAGSFDTDNLISNERSYQHVVPALEEAGVRAGAYIGVGPDQNFSYIAAIRPSVALIVDVRRDNLLLHLLFKALFESSRTRVEYLSLLFGRAVPRSIAGWRTAPLDRIIAYIDETRPDEASVSALRTRIDASIVDIGVPLSAGDVATIDRFHRAFIEAGLSLQFLTYGQLPRSYYPTYRELLTETDLDGRRRNYLTSEEDFQFVRSLQTKNAIVPVVGNLAGPGAMAAIARYLVQRGERLSAFYVSNVEFYLFSSGLFPQYIENLNRLPRNDRAVVIRSIFTGRAVYVPDAKPGYASASVTQRVAELVADFAAGKYRRYQSLVNAESKMPLRLQPAVP